jgi:rhodanese-related sulfurtransferase
VSEPVGEISVHDAAEAAEANSVLLLDVREDDEWTAGRAPGAVHMPLSSLDVATVPSDLPIVAVCRSGNRSGQAAEVLAAAGIAVVNMTGGMKAWAQEGLPVIAAGGRPGEIA